MRSKSTVHQLSLTLSSKLEVNVRAHEAWSTYGTMCSLPPSVWCLLLDDALHMWMRAICCKSSKAVIRQLSAPLY
eukprot:4309849-Amphidinium_carterae.1